MNIEYVMKCSMCKHLLPLKSFGKKNRIINNIRVPVMKKTCIECSYNVNECNSRFKQRHNNVSAYYYRLGVRNLLEKV